MVDIQGTEYSNLLDATGGAAAEYGASYLHTIQAGTTDLGAAGLASAAGLGGSFTAESVEAYSSEGGMGAGLLGAGLNAMELGGAGASYGAFESVSSSTEVAGMPGIDVGGFGGVAGLGGLAGAGGGAAYESSYYSSSVAEGGAGGIGGALVAAGGVEHLGAGAEIAGHVLPLSAYRIQEDLNPTIVRRTFVGAPTTYRQNIMVRFLKPPTPPAPGPLIIKEIRPPQPKPAPPLVIRQRPPRPKTPPPLVLRERPPRMPAVVKTETIVKKLPAFPAPPRQVIIERYPALPPKPRDVIIERWLQYGPMPKRRVIYQKAAMGRIYRTPKNLVIQYVAPRPHVQRIFRRLGVVSMNPSAYISAHGASLLDSTSLVSTARSAGVIENISPPALVYPAASSMSASSLLRAGGGSFEAGAAEMISGGAVESYGAGYEAVYGGVTGGGLGAAELAGVSSLGPSLYSVTGGAGYGVGGEFLEGATGGSFEYSASSVEMGGGLAGGLAGGIAEAAAELSGEIAGMNVEGGAASYESSTSYTVAESTA